MTELFTCSYAEFEPSMGAPVCISLGLPKWRFVVQLRHRGWEATPRGRYFNADDEVFTAAYVAQLERYGPERITARLEAIAAEAGDDRPGPLRSNRPSGFT